MPERTPRRFSADGAGDFYFDTVTLGNFALVERTDLLVRRYARRALVTPQVMDELLEGVAVGYTALGAVTEAVGQRRLGSSGPFTPDEHRIQVELLRSLGPGEASIIACAKVRGGTVVADDRAARSACAGHGVPCTGTIGILLASVRDGSLTPGEADDLHASMVQAGFFSPVRRVSDLL